MSWWLQLSIVDCNFKLQTGSLEAVMLISSVPGFCHMVHLALQAGPCCVAYSLKCNDVKHHESALAMITRTHCQYVVHTVRFGGWLCKLHGGHAPQRVFYSLSFCCMSAAAVCTTFQATNSVLRSTVLSTAASQPMWQNARQSVQDYHRAPPVCS